MGYEKKVQKANTSKSSTIEKPKSTKSQRMSLVVRDREIQMLEVLKKDLGISYNAIIRMAIKEYYEKGFKDV